MFSRTFLDWSINDLKTLGAAAFPSVTDAVSAVVLGGDTNLYQALVVREKLNTRSYDRFI